jgi:Skp family chaperone for outer membrane proteins
MSKILIAAAILAACAMSPARAADAPAAPKAGASAPLGGPLVKGVCFLSKEAVQVNAKAGVAIDTRVKQLEAQAQAEVNAQRAPIDADFNTLKADAAKTPAPSPVDIENRRLAIQVRFQTVQDLAEQRTREILASRQKAFEALSNQMQPILAAAYKTHGCGLLLDRNALLGGNTGGDLTADVIKGLDARITTVTFDRETLPPPVKK